MSARSIRILLVSSIFVVLAAAIMVRVYPQVVVLFSRDVTIRSPYCTRWDAMLSVRAKHNQAAVFKALASQARLLKRDADLELWATPRGQFWMPKGGGKLLAYLLAEEEESFYGNEALGVRSGDVVIDCGAFVGTTVKQALLRGARKVVAVEPAPENLKCLQLNLAREITEGRVVVYSKGVWDRNDVLTIRVVEENPGADSFVMHQENSGKVLKLPLTTIDKMVEELKLDRVDYIKMDIEGAEKKALVGGRQTLAKFHPRLALATYHEPGDPVKIPELVRQAWPGYRMECGPCVLDRHEVFTYVIFFR
ncbi:MAG: FkbM family methyltransferase [Bryobacteraceae bacterium]